MAFVSKAQQRWANTPKGTEALGGKEKVAEWQAKSPKRLPERIGPTKNQIALAQLKRGMQGNKV